MLLQGKKFLLCVSGGIASYKALELLRLLIKKGAEVKVAMTIKAQNFVTPLSFEALSGYPVLLDGRENWSNQIDHISYASWADYCILAPATMNSLCKFAYGIADNVMLSTMLAFNSSIYFAPSANTNMYLSPQSIQAMARLKEMGHLIIEPREDLLACRTYGIGAMEDVEEIAFRLSREALKHPFYEGKKVIVSGGGSFEAIDEVRCLTNHSSGIQASSFALALFFLGAEVIFVSSQKPMLLPKGITHLNAKSTQDFFENIQANLDGAEYYFGVAALSDFIPATKQSGKIKKSEGLHIDFKENLDILKTLKGVKKIGFKAEKDPSNAESYAKAMLEEKQCQYVCLNLLEESNDFGKDQNRITLFCKNGKKFEFALQDKFNLALEILKQIALND